MRNSLAIQTVLNSIDHELDYTKKIYQNAYWLKTPFEINVWECDFSGINKTIDFNVLLPDGKKLTDSKHSILLNTFKHFLCVQTHPNSQGKKLSGESVYRCILKTIHIIDYLLLNSDHYKLHENCLSTVTENDLINLLLNIGNSKSIYQSVYHWNEKVSNFLKEKIQSLTQDMIDHAIKICPSIEINYYDNSTLNLTNKELIKSKIWLLENNFYKITLDKNVKKIFPNNTKIAQHIYANTVLGKLTAISVMRELGINQQLYFTKEYKSVPVRIKNSSGKMSDSQFTKYFKTLRNMGLLKSIELPIPYQALTQIKFSKLLESLALNTGGRFCLLPSHVVLTSLKNAIEFCITYGSDLVDSYLAVVKACHSEGKTLFCWERCSVDITVYLSPLIKNLGVKRWLVQKYKRKGQEKLNNKNYYFGLRANEGLWELLRVLYGAIQIIVGTLMARRQGELLDLQATKCLDSEKRHLIFFNRKSGYDGRREKIARPIPSIAVQMIFLLEKLQLGLKENGIIDRLYPLFCYPQPHKKGLVNIDNLRFDMSTNLFCDYMEIPLDKNGNRYYIRQHQLRRFFAMLFFWGSSFGGMDTLRWFLAHTDAEHLYHYVTENTPGDVLRGVKAHYATEQLQSYDDSATALSDLLEKKFGTRKFDLMSSDELDDYIKNLIDEGSVRIEPEFFNTDDGNSYRILIRVIEKP